MWWYQRGRAGKVKPSILPCLRRAGAGTARPLASDLNYAAGETRANLVVVKLGTGGRVTVYPQVGTHLVFDVAGWVS